MKLLYNVVLTLACNIIHRDKDASIVLRMVLSSSRKKDSCELINPWHIREGYGSRSVSVSVCLCVCYHANCYIRTLFFRQNSGVIRLSVLFSTYALCGFR